VFRGVAEKHDATEWGERLSLGIGGRIRELRQRPGVNLSAQALADRTREYGHELKRSVIANLESGRRANVSVADLLVLATALDVPPAMLVYPIGAEASVEALPGYEMDTVAAMDWFTGASGRAAYAKGGGPEQDEEWEAERASYRIFELYARYGMYRRRVLRYSNWLQGNPSDDSARTMVGEARRELEALRVELQNAELPVPARHSYETAEGHQSRNGSAS
jgi:transcriptional regulator with XRE-family HTH domain